MAYYHITENKYLESIFDNGLVPQNGIRSGLIGDPKTAVFYSKGYEGVIAMFFMMIERYVEYRGFEGDVHISAYEALNQMIERRKREHRDVGEYLQTQLSLEAGIVTTVGFVRQCADYKEFLGDGVCLKINCVLEDETDDVFTFYNSWTNSPIPPEDISIVMLRNQVTGETLSSKYDVIDYFMSRVSLDDMRKVLYDTEKREQGREEHLLWNIMSDYYRDNKDRLEHGFENYEIVELPLLGSLDKSNAQGPESSNYSQK